MYSEYNYGEPAKKALQQACLLSYTLHTFNMWFLCSPELRLPVVGARDGFTCTRHHSHSMSPRMMLDHCTCTVPTVTVAIDKSSCQCRGKADISW